MRHVSFFFLVAIGAVAACEDSIHGGWLVDRPRVLGARVSAVADANRAALVPGERARVEWLVASPEGPPRLAWTFAVCNAPDGLFARPRCERAVVASGSGESSSELITTELAVPPAQALAGARELLVLAAFCSDGAPTLDPRAFTATCASGDALLASVLARVDGANANPPAPAVRLGDVPLAPDERGEGCDVAHKVAPGAAVDVVHVFGGAVREPGESVTLSTIVTGGELDRQYSTFDAEEAAPKEVRVAWKAPEDVPAAGRVVRLYALLRDDRGGASFARFSVCVRP
ncbi:MAG: hypothetical protein R3F34_20705 [Planctomycetota bacterium]